MNSVQEKINHQDGVVEVVEGRVKEENKEFAKDIIEGLTGKPKHIPCRWLYDEKGSWLFEEICTLAEYYPTRAEKEILLKRAEELASLFTCSPTVMELGSGNAQKSRILLEAILRSHGSARYMPVDISREILVKSTRALLRDYPTVQATAIAGDYREGLRHLQKELGGPRLVLWLGGSIGNLEPIQALNFLSRIGEFLRAGDRLLIGIDLRKSSAVILPAYDDSCGITAKFNKNLLARINRELDGDLNLSNFSHRAHYNDKLDCVEMHLVSECEQRARLKGLELELEFQKDESIHTESSFKYSFEQISWLVHGAGLHQEKQWLDNQERFSVNVFLRE